MMRLGLLPQKSWVPIHDSFEVTECDIWKEKTDLKIFTPWVMDPKNLPPTARQDFDYSIVRQIALPYAKPICEDHFFDFNPDALNYSVDIVKKEGIQFLYALFGHDPGMMAQMISSQTGIQFAVSFFGFDFQVDVGNRSWRVRHLLKHCAFARCETEKAKAKLTYFLPEAEDKIIVVPAAFNPSKFTPTEPTHDSEKEIIILTTNRLIDVKGVREMVSAFIKASAKNDKLHWRVIGDGPLKEEMQVLIGNAGLLNKLSVFSGIDEAKKLELLRDADIFAAPYVITEQGDCDNMPLSTMEAFSVGLPTIMGHDMGYPNVEDYSIVANPKPESDELVNAIINLAEDKDRRKTLGEKARTFAVENLDFEKNSEILLEEMSKHIQ